MKKSRLIALFTSVMLIISTLFMSVPAFASTTTGTQTATRLGGANRYEVAANIATTYFKTASTVILVNGADEKLADGLAATPLAKAYNAPILLTAANSIPTETQAALDTIKPSSYIIIGGPASVSDSIKTSLGATRIGGADRYEVATNVAEALKAKLGVTSFSNAVITNGAKFADALAAAPFAAKASEPVLFVTANTNDSATKATIGELGTLGITTTDAIGGSASIPDSVVTAVKGTRVNGATREDLSVAIASKYASNPAGVYAVNGYKPADALAIGPLAATTGYPVLYVNSDVKTVKAAVTDYVTATTTIKPENVVAVGGTASVSDAQQGAVVTAATPVKLAVSSISAINAKQIQVVFTKAVNSADAVVAARYAVGGYTATPVLQSDGKTVILTLNAALDNTVPVAVTVNPVESAADTSVTSPLFATTVSVNDTTAPTVASVTTETTTGAKATTATVTFSEPVSAGTIKIDGVANVVTPDSTTTVVSGLSLDPATTHTLEVIGVKDYALASDGTSAANTNAYYSTTFKVTVDSTAPTATVTPNGDKSVLVTFNKAVNDSTVVYPGTGTPNITLNDELLNPVTISTIAKSTTVTNGYVITIDPSVTLYSSLSSRTLTAVFNANIKDSIGNSFVATTKAVTLTKDKVAPSVSKVSFDKNSDGSLKDITIKYSESLLNTTVDATKLTIVDSNGVLVTGKLNTGTISGDTVTFTATAGYTPNAKLTITIPAGLVSDLAETANTSTASTATIDLTTAPTSTTTFNFNGTITQSKHADKWNTITVDYNLASGVKVKGGAIAGSATDPNNYSIDGKILPSTTVITLDSAQQVATITLPDGFITSNEDATFRINNVQLTTGEVINPAIVIVNGINENVLPTATLSAGSTASSLTLQFNEALYSDNVTPATDIANAAEISADFTGTNCTINSAVYNKAAKTITFNITVTDTTKDASFVNSTNLYDSVGNLYVPQTATLKAGATTWTLK